MTTIRSLEEIALNAWPCLQTVFLDGWLLRFANGYTRRANSINPLYASTQAVQGKIEACEQLYHARGLKSVFKMTPDSLPSRLDAALAQAGYRSEARSSVQLLDLTNRPTALNPGMSLVEAFSQEWLDAYCQMNAVEARHRPTIRELFERLVPAKRLALLREDDRIVACGLAAQQGEFVGLFDIVVDSALRRRGYGQRLVEGLLAWGKQAGAQTAYLQVMLDNPPACQLYSKLGFEESYQYWYRVKG